MTETSSVGLCTICQCAPTPKELRRECKPRTKNVVHCVKCDNVVHYKCLREYFAHLDEGKETCPNCRHDFPIIHPESTPENIFQVTNHVLGKLVVERMPEKLLQINRLAKIYESNAREAYNTAPIIDRVTADMTAAIKDEAERRVSKFVHPPSLDLADRRGPVWQEIDNQIRLVPGHWLRINQLSYIKMHLTKHLKKTIIIERHNRMQILHEENMDECLRLLKDIICRTAREDAESFAAIPQDFEFSHKKKGMIMGIYTSFFKNAWTGRIVSKVRAACHVKVDDLYLFRTMYKTNKLSDEEWRELFKAYDEAASEVLGVRPAERFSEAEEADEDEAEEADEDEAEEADEADE